MASDLTRLNVNLIPKAVAAMETAAAMEELSQTDTVNRALQVHAFLVEQKAAGKELLIRDPHGNLEVVHIV